MRFKPALCASFIVLLALVTPSFPASAQTPQPIWSPRIAIVWPHDAQGDPTPVSQALLVNVGVWPANRVSCTEDPQAGPGGVHQFYLWMAQGNDVLEQVGVNPVLVRRTVNGVTFPSDEYNDVPASLNPKVGGKYTFAVGLSPTVGNVWVHGADPRTIYPNPVVPVGFGTPAAGQIESRIQIVWPHDAQGHPLPVTQARLVNIAVDLFVHPSVATGLAPGGPPRSVPLDFQPDALTLLSAHGNDQINDRDVHGQLYPRAQKVTYTANGQTFPRWVFNDVPVDPRVQDHFLAPVYSGKLGSPYVNIWTHSASALTYLPQPTPPPACVP